LQWLAAGGQDTPLAVLTASVRAMVMISDIFTQESQYSWMLGALSDLYKLHPPEDELMGGLLLLGISKAVSVITNAILKSHKYDFLAGCRVP
jgi:huntingtin